MFRLRLVCLLATATAIGPALGEPIYSPLSDNKIEVGAAKDALIQVIGPGVHPYVAANESGYREQAKVLGLTNVQITQSNFDAATEVANIQNAITKGAKAIIIEAVSSQGIIPSIEKANKQGICTIGVINNAGEGDGEVYPGMKAYVGWKEEEGSRYAGEWLAQAMGGKGNVVIIQGILASTANRYRVAGAEKLWREKYPGIKVIASQPADYDGGKARRVAQDMVQRYGKRIDGAMIITNNMASAAADVFANSPLGKKIPIVSFGAQGEFIDYINRGFNIGTTVFAPRSEAARALDLAVQCINGDRTPVFAPEKELPPARVLKDHNYVVDAKTKTLYQPQW